MSKLLRTAMQELESIYADASRLSGNRQRYSRYGFESCGQNVHLFFNKSTLINRFPDPREIEFVRICENDSEALEFCCALYNKNEIAVTRNARDGYLSMIAWEHEPYLCLWNGRPVGYLCADVSGQDVAEIFAVDTAFFADILCCWQKKKNTAITFTLQPHMTELLRQYSAISDIMRIQSPSHFLIRNWVGVISAFLKLKAKYCQLQVGELTVKIEDYGTVRIFVNESEVGCERTDKSPQLTVTGLEATRLIFGPLAPGYTVDAGPLAANWFPLPLSWNGQDRA